MTWRRRDARTRCKTTSGKPPNFCLACICSRCPPAFPNSCSISWRFHWHLASQTRCTVFPRNTTSWRTCGVLLPLPRLCLNSLKNSSITLTLSTQPSSNGTHFKNIVPTGWRPLAISHRHCRHDTRSHPDTVLINHCSREQWVSRLTYRFYDHSF